MLQQLGTVWRSGFAPCVSSSPAPRRFPLVMASADPHGMKLLFVEMGTGYDQHGQNVTTAAMRACKNAISSNSIPAFRTGALPGVSYQQMKLKLKLGVPHSVQHELDLEQVKSVFPYFRRGINVSLTESDGLATILTSLDEVKLRTSEAG